MFKRDHIKTKLIAFVLLNALLCAVYFIFPRIEPRGESTWVWGLRNMLIYCPLAALIYGVGTALTAFCDRGYVALMSAVFLICGLIHGFAELLVSPEFSLIYFAMMIGAALVAFGIKALCVVTIRYKNSKRTKEE